MKLLSLLTLTLLWGKMSFCGELRFPPDFFFGIANAPSQVEDQLDDIWMDFAREGNVRAFSNIYRPEERLHFWSNPETELDLAKELGVQVFRLGIDWQRLVPQKGVLDRKALAHYRSILEGIHARGMKVMLTLFHHTEPRWTYAYGGWRKREMVEDFAEFWKPVLSELADKIDYLITFNEAQVYALLSQIAGEWPYVRGPSPLGLFNLGPIPGRFERSLKNMAKSHAQIYDWVKEHQWQFPIGIAHNVANYKEENFWSALPAWMSWRKMNLRFADLVAKKVDFMGLNYYGREAVKGTSVILSPDLEYSDSGRGIDPQGLYKILTELNKRYKTLPFIITENGLADQNDWVRPAYLIEHLAAVKAAMDEGVKVLGYIHWTLTDNFEWADGYCPKFGLVAALRAGEGPWEREKRDSFFLFSEIAQTKLIPQATRAKAWGDYMARKGQSRPQCRALDGVHGLDIPRADPLRGIDWRFQQ